MNKQSKIHFQDEDFIRKNSLLCSLFLQIDGGLCKILICDEEGNHRYAGEFDPEDFWDKKWPLINLKFAKSKILTLPESFIFIPKEFSSSDQESLVAPFLDSNSPVLNMPIKNTAITTYFTINNHVLNFQNLLNDSKIVASPTLLIKRILSVSLIDTVAIGISIYKEDFELAYVKNKQFIFYNRFPKSNADDFNYYLLAVFEQFSISAGTAQFYLTGDIAKLDENHERLSKYSSHIYFLADLDKKENSAIVENNFSNQFFLLSELTECV